MQMYEYADVRIHFLIAFFFFFGFLFLLVIIFTEWFLLEKSYFNATTLNKVIYLNKIKLS